MTYTSISTNRPGARFREAKTQAEVEALMVEVWSVVTANGGESVVAGADLARGVNVSLTTYPDAASAAKSIVELTAKQLIEFESSGQFMALDEWLPVAGSAMEG